MGRYCIYLLRRQDGRTFQIYVSGKFLPSRWVTLYKFPSNVNEFTFPITGVSVQKGPEKDGMKGLDTATVTFKDVRVPSANVLGGSVGKGSAMLAECSLRQALKNVTLKLNA